MVNTGRILKHAWITSSSHQAPLLNFEYTPYKNPLELSSIQQHFSFPKYPHSQTCHTSLTFILLPSQPYID